MPQTKKKVSKKPASAGKAREARTTLIRAHGATCFWVHNGPIICDLLELQSALKSNKITDVQWKHHVTGQRNDFATWIRDVFRNEALAKKFKAAGTKSAASKVLNTSLKP